MLTDLTKSPMIAHVCDLLNSLEIPSSSYNDVLYEFDNKCGYLDDMLISMNSEVEKSKSQLY